MIFFATDKIYRVIQIKQKNEYGQLIISSSIENLPYIPASLTAAPDSFLP